MKPHYSIPFAVYRATRGGGLRGGVCWAGKIVQFEIQAQYGRDLLFDHSSTTL